MATFTRGRLMPYAGLTGPFGTFTNHTINQTSDQVEFIVQAPEAATITHLGYRYGARTGTPVQHKISLQGVGTDGNPDGTILGGGTPASGLFTPPADATFNGLWKWVQLDNPIAVTRGQMLAIVIAPVGTPDGSNSSSFTTVVDFATRIGFPCAIANDGGARTRSAAYPVWGMKSASAVYGFPCQSVFVTVISTTSEQAVKFTLPFAMKIAGIEVFFSEAASKSVAITLYDGTTALQTWTFDADAYSTTSSGRVLELLFTDATLSSLVAGNTYRIGFAPQEVSANMLIFGFTFASAADLAAMPSGANMTLSTRASGGGTAWTDDDTTRVMAALIVDDISGPFAGQRFTIFGPKT